MVRGNLQMRAALRSGALIACLALTANALGETRQDCEQQFKPQSGQPGKDVVWVPTNDALVMRMLKMANVAASDLVYDLGAGDGKIAIAAAKHFGARSVGVEYDPALAKLAQCFAKVEGVADRARIVNGDIFETDFSDASVVTLYLLPELNLRLRPTILKMKPGTRIVSHSFLMEDWDPDDRSMTEDGHAYLWIVPANIDGRWMFKQKDGKDRLAVQFEQKFQEINGTAGERKTPLTNAKLHGDQLKASFPEKGATATLAGRVNGERIEARITRGGTTSNYIGERM
ncbi:MAG: class I SAM-dependent methyltransferase [Steroidobacter sp.]